MVLLVAEAQGFDGYLDENDAGDRSPPRMHT
jgi:hypothetical protein